MKKMRHIYNGLIFSYTKEGNLVTCGNMDGICKHYAEWNKTKTDKYHMNSLICDNLKAKQSKKTS